MRRLLGNIFKGKNIKKTNIACNFHPQLHSKNKTEVLPKDRCMSCKEDMCYICADQHIKYHCDVSMNLYKDLGSGILKQFNYGEVMKVDLRDIKCICGKKLDDHSAICAACGLASCSQHCHHEWEKKGFCTYKQNFVNLSQNVSLRSILLKNISNIRRSNIKRWSLANRTNTSFISCYASREPNFVFFQRGYRNYGIPNEEFINRFQHLSYRRGIDYITHQDRLCDCSCSTCSHFVIHPAGNCQYRCQKIFGGQLERMQINPKYHLQCECSCQFCRSGIIIDSHRLIDCHKHCLNKSVE